MHHQEYAIKTKLLLMGVLCVVTLILFSESLTPPTLAKKSFPAATDTGAMSEKPIRRASGDPVTRLVPTAVITVGGPITVPTTWTAGNLYVVLNQDVIVDPGVTLTIEPGVIVKFDRRLSLLVDGANSALRVLGTHAHPAYFTSYRDDAIGGDTNGDGSATVPAPGDWFRIEFGWVSNSATSLVDHADIRYGGGTYYHEPFGAITLQSASPTIRNSSVHDNWNFGISMNASSPMIQNSIIHNNGNFGIYADASSPVIQNSTIRNNQNAGIYTNASSPVLACNNIQDNGLLRSGHLLWGLYNLTPGTVVNAQNQWWGSASGPYHATTNPSGTGNAVTDGVDYTPWLQVPCGATSNGIFLPFIGR